MNPNLYDVLDVEPTASDDEIRQAWKSAIADLGPTDRRFRVYNQAAETLLDPARRRAYDAELAAQDADEAAAAEPDAAPAPAPAPGSAVDVPEAPRRTGRIGWVVPTWLLIGVAVLLVASAALTTYLFTQPSEAAVEAATSSARTAAETAIEPLLSYDYRTLDQDQRDAEKYLTSRYRTQYDQLFRGVVTQNAKSTRTVVDVQVIDSAIVRAGTDRAQILLFINRPTTNAKNRQPVVYKDQVTVTMQKVDGRWLVDDLQTSPVAP